MTFDEAIAWLRKQRDDVIWERTDSNVPVVKLFVPATGDGYLVMWDMWQNQPIYFHINYDENPVAACRVDDVPLKDSLIWRTGSWFALDDNHPAIVEWYKEQYAL